MPADFAAQADLAWQNLMAILEFNGMRMKDVVKITHFLTDAANLPAYNEVRSKYLGEERPASTLLIVAGPCPTGPAGRGRDGGGHPALRPPPSAIVGPVKTEQRVSPA